MVIFGGRRGPRNGFSSFLQEIMGGRSKIGLAMGGGGERIFLGFSSPVAPNIECKLKNPALGKVFLCSFSNGFPQIPAKVDFQKNFLRLFFPYFVSPTLTNFSKLES